MTSSGISTGHAAGALGGGDYAPDLHRRRVLWLAIALIGLLTVSLVVLVAYGPGITTFDYEEPLLLIGLIAIVTCTVAYFADKEREQRAENRRLIQQLQDTASALDARVARLNKLSETSVRLAGALDIDRISELVVEALVEQVHADAASLVLVDTTRNEYVHAHSAGRLTDAGETGSDPIAIAKAAAASGPAISDVPGHREVVDRLRAWERIRTSISAPMKISEVVGGALAAMRRETFDTEDLNLLTTLANMASKAIESAELHQRLRQSYYRTLLVLARSLAARDPYSAAHGEAVTWLALRLAEGLGLTKVAVEALRSYGPLHDLGKIGVADSLLAKQGPLTDEEVVMVRQHTIIGESIIQPLNPGADALAMIRSHHERWDGLGYPDKLKGDDVPLLARVVAVADAYHAIVSHRPYRGGQSPVQAVQEIKYMSGSQFDPAVVDALVHLWHSGQLADFGIRLTQGIGPSDSMDAAETLLGAGANGGAR